MNGYTMKEVAKKINVPPGIIRQWEKDLEGLVEFPRSKQGARIYSDALIELFIELRELSIKKPNKEEIRDWVQKKQNTVNITSSLENKASFELVPETLSPVHLSDTVMNNTEQFHSALEAYKQNFLNELKEEVKGVIRKEFLAEIKKEINNGTLTTVKQLSNSIYKSTENTKTEIEGLTVQFEKITEHTVDSLKFLSNRITSVSIDTAEEINNLSKQLSETSEELSQYVDATNNEIFSLTEEISKDREYFIEEREQYRHEIRKREVAFQNMLSSFRDTAAAKERKWWKFWV